MTPLPSWDGPGRLWSLWDMLTSLGPFLRIREENRGLLEKIERLGNGVIAGDQRDIVKLAFNSLLRWSDKSGFETVKAVCQFAVQDLDSPDLTNEHLISRIKQINESLQYDAGQRSFWLVHHKKLLYFDASFGEEVDKAFPDATWEIKEAGSCYAVARNTAAVFHLMRAAEHALRGSVIAVGLTTPKLPLEYQQWQNLVDQFASRSKAEVETWQEPMKTNGRAFFSRIIADFYAFKDDVRNVCMHTRSGGTYDTPGALSVRNRVEECLKRVAEKLNASTASPPSLLDSSLFS